MRLLAALLRPGMRQQHSCGGQGSRRASKFSPHSGTVRLSSVALVLVPEQGRGRLLEVFRKSECPQLVAAVQGRPCSWHHTHGPPNTAPSSGTCRGWTRQGAPGVGLSKRAVPGHRFAPAAPGLRSEAEPFPGKSLSDKLVT